MKVRIYNPSRSATQSGLAKTQNWILEYVLTSKRSPEPLMGWSASSDTLNQVKLKFYSKEDAVAHAKEQGWEYSVAVDQQRKVKPRSYADNFKYIPPTKTRKRTSK